MIEYSEDALVEQPDIELFRKLDGRARPTLPKLISGEVDIGIIKSKYEY